MNIQRNKGRSVTERLPVRYELIDKDGKQCAWAENPHDLILFAERMWPGEEQDEERSGKGWDIQVVGS